MNELSAIDAAEQLKSDPENTVLLDVREPVELEVAAIPGALHIPMGETPSRLDEIDRGKTIICMCHHGGRSAQVAGYLLSQGYENVANLSGGINAWSLQVDSDIPTY